MPTWLDPTSLLLDRHVGGGNGNKTAVVIDQQEISYVELLAEVSRLAQGLRDLGMETGSRLLLFGSDSREYVSTWLAAVRVGVIPVTVSDLYKASQLCYFLGDTEVKALFIDAEQVHKLGEIAGSVASSLQHVIVARGEIPSPAIWPPGAEIVSYADLAAAGSGSKGVQRHQNDMAYMLYSGGTTGPAKGVVHLAHDVVLVPERQGAFWEYGEGDVCHATSKKYFTHGLWPGLLMPLYFGATAVLSQSPPVPARLAALIDQTSPTVLVTVPTVVRNLLAWSDGGGEVDLSSVRLAVTASEKLPEQLSRRFKERFGVDILDSIGSSEVTYEWIANRPQEARRGTLGKPVFGYDVLLLDEAGREVREAGRPGEAWVRSRTSCLFYWRQLNMTKETFVGEWTRTGDVLEFDEDGFYGFAGRRDDLFKVHGLWVSPVEVEERLTRHPAVLDVGVVGTTDDSGLTEIVAFVVLRPDAGPLPELERQLRDLVAEVGSFKVPSQFRYVSELPRTTLLKLDRRALAGR